MSGEEHRQISFLDTGFACAHLVDKKNFYAKMRKFADKIITDNQLRISTAFDLSLLNSITC